MAEEQQKQDENKGKIVQPQVPVYEEPIYVARTLTILCGFASQGVAWDSESGYFYQSSDNPDGSKTWKQMTTFRPRKLALPMLELLKKYAACMQGGRLFICSPREVENIFHGLFNIPLL